MTELDPAVLVDAIRETGIALRPGDVLAVRLPLSMNRAEVAHAHGYGQAVERETGLRVAFVPGEEFAHSTVNVTVNFTGDPADLAREIREAIRRNGGSSPL